jgi:RNA polymerase sigma factor (sigma-70 family)
LGARAEAEDVAQETLTRALLRWSTVEGHEQAWVATVALRMAIDTGRRRKRRAATEVTDHPAAAEDWERRLDLHAALRRLPKRQQQALACRYLADLPDEETARLLEISSGSVKQHAARGLAALRGTVMAEGTSHA